MYISCPGQLHHIKFIWPSLPFELKQERGDERGPTNKAWAAEPLITNLAKLPTSFPGKAQAFVRYGAE